MAQGSVFRKGTGWAFRVDTGYHAGTGKRRQLLKQGFPTKKAAQVALAEVISGSSKGSVVSKTAVRVETFLTDWLETARSRLRPTTLYSYEMAVHRIKRSLGRYQLQSLTPLQIEKFYADELAAEGRDGRPLAPKTVRNSHVVFTQGARRRRASRPRVKEPGLGRPTSNRVPTRHGDIGPQTRSVPSSRTLTTIA